MGYPCTARLESLDRQSAAWIAIALVACHSQHSSGDMGRPPQSVPVVAHAPRSDSFTLPEASQEGQGAEDEASVVPARAPTRRATVRDLELAQVEPWQSATDAHPQGTVVALGYTRDDRVGRQSHPWLVEVDLSTAAETPAPCDRMFGRRPR